MTTQRFLVLLLVFSMSLFCLRGLSFGEEIQDEIHQDEVYIVYDTFHEVIRPAFVEESEWENIIASLVPIFGQVLQFKLGFSGEGTLLSTNVNSFGNYLDFGTAQVPIERQSVILDFTTVSFFDNIGYHKVLDSSHYKENKDWGVSLYNFQLRIFPYPSYKKPIAPYCFIKIYPDIVVKPPHTFWFSFF
ncbi:MAG: hypothetical protein AB1349_11775 [Elusimicrobiota bacterium]